MRQHPDLALTEYARLGQALCMYQVCVYSCCGWAGGWGCGGMMVAVVGRGCPAWGMGVGEEVEVVVVVVVGEGGRVGGEWAMVGL